ncbi:protein translocase subunit SecF [Candidatus Rhodoluna planktonica]|uniref:Protein-export membrane protein SecF n=1 Tax=Candidatus Rhodoluna planktonica TaxID=535712 RepID=A0A1D9DZ16_9MICO|nr:protein translocase subunit SecF [Candidatus Rhodoluna planktonica]AOY56039.1 preprotein translocase subunit SecF [Candidatus Rhodoluna planktonica]
MSKFSDFGNDLYTGKRSINFVGRRKYWYAIAAVMIALSAILPIARGGFNFGIEFRGGSEFRITDVAGSSSDLARDAVLKIDAELDPVITTVGNDLRIQTEKLEDLEAEEIRVALADAYQLESEAVSSSFIGANWGADVTSKAINGLVVFVALAAILMALYFRTLKMSIAAVIALLHDLIITAGVYGATGFEVTPAAVIGFLTILGYSLYDTVVVFDKIRENTLEVEHSETTTFAEQVNYAINQTLVRSINTSVVAVLPVASILFIGSTLLGAGTLKDIALALFIGIIVGTYSTIFIAAPLYSHLRESETKFQKKVTA